MSETFGSGFESQRSRMSSAKIVGLKTQWLAFKEQPNLCKRRKG